MERTCFECINFSLCFLKRKIEDATIGVAILNIDGDATPGRWEDIFKALANACIVFKEKKGE